jgi:hypothetical protein
MGTPREGRDVSGSCDHDESIDKILGDRRRDSGKVQQRDEPLERNLNIDQTV